MSGIKEYLFRCQEGEDASFSGREEIARALGGHVDGNKVYAPSPGCPPDDESLVIQFSDPSDLSKFFIYDCACPLGRAYAYVREKLGLIAPDPDRAAENQTFALKIWNETGPAEGTIVGAYLRGRGITLLPDSLRYHPKLKQRPSGREFPAMVALVTDSLTGAPLAIHRTFLQWCGGKAAKAPVSPAKMTLGPIRGGVIRLSDTTENLVIGEGIETTLSVMMRGRPGWAAISANGLRNLRLPPDVRRLTLLADGDPAGRHACAAAARRLSAEGRDAGTAFAPNGYDFNDVLPGRAPPGGANGRESKKS